MTLWSDPLQTNPALSGVVNPPETTEAGWKDTVIAHPGEVTRVNSIFDIAGLYVWRCDVVEHEDNEMMVPYCVGARPPRRVAAWYPSPAASHTRLDQRDNQGRLRAAIF